MDDLSELPSEEAADQVANESTNNEVRINPVPRQHSAFFWNFPMI